MALLAIIAGVVLLFVTGVCRLPAPPVGLPSGLVANGQQPQAPAAAPAPPAGGQQFTVTRGEHSSCPNTAEDAAKLWGGTKDDWSNLGYGGRPWRKWKFAGGNTVLTYPGWGSFDHFEAGHGYRANLMTNELTANCHN